MSAIVTLGVRRGASVLLALLLALLASVMAATAAHAAPSLSASPNSGLDPAKDATVRVRGSGYDTSKGIYVAYCVVPAAGKVPSPCGGGADTSGTSGGSVWISNDPPPYGDGLAQPYGSGGSFDVRVTVTPRIGDVDCTRTACAVVTRNDHTRGSDRGQDVIVPVTFSDPKPDPTPDPKPEPKPAPEPEPTPTPEPEPEPAPTPRATSEPSASSSPSTAGSRSTSSAGATPDRDATPEDGRGPGEASDEASAPADDEAESDATSGDDADDADDADDTGDGAEDGLEDRAAADGAAVEGDDVEVPVSALGTGRGPGAALWVPAASVLAVGGAAGVVVWRRRRAAG